MTNQLVLLVLVSTNWINVSGDWKREGQTNYVKQRLVVSTNMWLVETRVCVTSNLVREAHSTNGLIRWEPVGAMLPPLPGVGTKE